MFKRIRWGKSQQSRDAVERRASDPPSASTRRPSTLSTFDIARGRPSEPALALTSTVGSSLRARRPSPSSPALGLHIIHQPEFASLDIIFVHGLGGHSQRTWSKHHDPTLFWPELWLPFEPDVGTARIMTFGYNANWRGSTKNGANITDFAKELLFELRFAKDDSGDDFDIGAKPIIFVVHSMGGLVVKKAYMLGLHDENYQRVVRSISAIIFLSTPHRGTNLAETLNRVLAASFQPSKNFIADLTRSSPAIEELNEQFRHLAPRLSIWSFYETLATSIGPKKIMVLEKDSSVLGYPAEISRPLRADHHDVCKYTSPADSNYISVRNAIKSLVGMFRSKASQESESSELESTARIQQLFRNCVTSDDDYHTLRRYWIPDTCGWFLSEAEFAPWLEGSTGSHVLWFAAPPASGKSVLAAFMVNHLLKSGRACQFFLFKYSDPTKRSVASCLRAIALQLSRDQPDFRRQLGGSSTEMLEVDATDPSLIWRSIFERVLFQSNIDGQLFWVIDALDECDSPKLLLDYLRSLSESGICVRILILSRNTDVISFAFDRLSDVLPTSRIEKSGEQYNQQDIAHFVQQEMKHMRGSDDFRKKLIQNILSRARGNFLWARLVLDEIMSCHTEENIQEVLDEIPDDMMQLYERMERTLLISKRKSNERLIRAVLEWSTCAQRALTVKELAQALQPEFKGLLDLRRTIQDACGQFVQVDDGDKVGIIHHTAREYFTRSSDSRFHIDTHQTHGKMLRKTLGVLEEPGLRWRLLQGQHALQSTEPFVFYAAANWSYHLGHSHLSSSDHLDALVKFLRSPAVLCWIHILSLQRRLEVLVKASKVIAAFVKSTKKRNTSMNRLSHQQDLELLSGWVTDLVKIVGKFGIELVSEPGIVYELIPTLCPTQSMLHQQYHDPTLGKIKVLGPTNPEWSDNLARLPLPGEARAWSISCSGKYIAVLASTSVIFIWDSSNFTEAAAITHGEPVTAMTLSNSGSKLATYGLRRTKLWSIPSARLLSSTSNPPHTKAKQIIFAENGQTLLVGGDDNIVRTIRCDAFDQGWQILNPNLLKDTTSVQGAVVNSPMCLAFNGDNTQIGVSYRGAPLSVWRLADGKCISKCKRAKDFRHDQRRPSTNWWAVDRFTWNPVSGHVLGIYRDGCVFKWHPITDENIEVRSAGDEISASPNGKLFATSSSDGSVRVWDFSSFSVIYQLSSEDLVTGLSFSPDSRRFYDLRGSSVNAWESDSLTRFLENEGNISDTGSEDQSSDAISKISEECVVHFEAVTALAVAPDASSFCVGFADGLVRICERADSEGTELTRFYNYLQVTHLKWSPDGCYVAAADLAGDVQVLYLGATKVKATDGKSNGPTSMASPQIKLDDENIEDVIFSSDCQLLLLSTAKRLFVCSVRDGSLMTCSDLQEGSRWKWLRHPLEQDLLLGFGPSAVCTYSWKNLSKLSTSSYRELESRGRHQSVTNVVSDISFEGQSLASISLEDESKSTLSSVTSVTLTQDGQHILLHGRTKAGLAGNSKALLVFPVSQLAAAAANSLEPSTGFGFLPIPSRFSSHARAALGVLPGLGLAVLDQDLWLCTYSLDTATHTDDTDGQQRFYFIPRDWVGGSSLSCCTLAEDGTLFWPKDDKVVLIECNFDELRLSPLYS